MLRLESGNLYRADALLDFPWLQHGFGTRLESAWPGNTPTATLRQVHSANVVVAERSGMLGEGDALLSDRPDLTLAIRTADCLPVLMADSRNRAVAAIHAGWRGVVNGVVPRTIEAMAKHFETRSEDLTVAIGPGIGACCFEVGPEVATQFSELFPERSDLGGKVNLDLVEALVRQMGQSGIGQSQIDTSKFCTYCQLELFHSYRRDRQASGRMISAIRIAGR